MASYYPPACFHFKVELNGVDGANSDSEQRFQEVSGLSVEVETETLHEGGENRFEYKLPKRAKYPNLVLKRGYFSSLLSPLMTWADDAITNFDIKPCQVQVILLNDMHVPAQIWSFKNAYPVKVTMGDLKAMDNNYLIESMELTYQFFKRESLLDKLKTAVGL
jgi:phage tail-like protein